VVILLLAQGMRPSKERLLFVFNLVTICRNPSAKRCGGQLCGSPLSNKTSVPLSNLASASCGRHSNLIKNTPYNLAGVRISEAVRTRSIELLSDFSEKAGLNAKSEP